MRRIIGIAVVLLLAVFVALLLFGGGPNIPDRGVLVVELAGDLEEAPASDLLSRFAARGPALPTLVLQLDKAGADSRVVGVIVHIRGLELGIARIQELRDGIRRVRASGKPVIALLDVARLNATRELYLASAAERVYVVPGYLGPVAGIAGEVLTLGGLLAKGGVAVEYERVGIYKSAPEVLAERELSDVARKEIDALLDGLFAQLVAGIAEGRELAPDAVRALIDDSPATPEEYVAADLADGIADRAELLDAAEFEGAEEIELGDYAEVDPRELGLRDGPAIGLVFGDGAIESSRGRSPRSGVFAADAIVDALRDAAEDEEVRAIVLRVNSPGGSPLASDEIWRELRTIKKQKPVVVSMGDAAASGGYYVASAADAIVAQPATQTGSIGVYLQRMHLGGLFEKLEVGVEVFARGKNATMLASSQALTPGQRDRLREVVAAEYDSFLSRVSSGRGLPREAIDAIGQGRVFLGEAARELRLVDELGGLDAAVARAKREAGIPAEVDPKRVVFPGPRSLAEQIDEMTRGDLAWTLLGSLLETRVPSVVRAWAALAQGELALLPPYWVVLK
jgi:protease-4